jgi:hypothetical protein
MTDKEKAVRIRSGSMGDMRVFALVGLAAALVVFALPWMVPISPTAVYSDSQAAGFANKVAIAGLLAVCISCTLLAARRLKRQDITPLVLEVPARDGRIHPRVVAALALTCTVMTILVALLVKTHPVSDGAYFMNSILRVIAGGKPYSEIQFSYGPLMLYLPIVLWRAFAPWGLSPFAAYYICVAASHLLGLALVAYVLNRLDLSRQARLVLFVSVGLFSAAWFSLGLNYTALRFIAPYAALLYIGGTLTRPKGSATMRFILPTFLIGLAGAWSPEMGVAALSGTAVTLSLLCAGRHQSARQVMTALAVGTILLLLLLPLGSIGSFLGGSYNLPVLPGLPQVFFVGTMLTLAWSAGQFRRSTTNVGDALWVGLYVCALVLIAPALGRSDFVHTTWNGLGACFLAAASLRNHTLQLRYVRVGSALALTAIAAFTVARLGLLFDAAAASGSVSENAAVHIAALRGISEVDARDRYRAVRAQLPTNLEVQRLVDTPRVAFLDWPLTGLPGVELALHADLVPTYSSILDGDEIHLLLAQLEEADMVVVPHGLIEDGTQTIGAEGSFIRDRIVYVRPDQSLTRAANGLLFWMPVRVPARHPVIDAHASIAHYLKDGWRVDGRTRNYTWLTPAEE